MQPTHITKLEKSGEILFRLRDYTPIPLIIIALLLAHPTIETLIAGLILAALGELVRIYGVAFIGTISRTRSYSNGELVSSGPFSLMRNPLYFGNLLLSLGLAVMPGIWWLPLLFLVVFYLQYIPIVAWEEMKLRLIFGESYAEYCKKTPNKWFPSISIVKNLSWSVKPQSWSPALKSEKRTLTSVISFSIIMVILYYMQKVSQTANLLEKLFQ